MKVLRFLAILGAVGLLFSPFARGKVEYATKEKQDCVYCHTAFGKPDLNDIGKCYKEKRSLKDCEKNP